MGPLVKVGNSAAGWTRGGRESCSVPLGTPGPGAVGQPLQSCLSGEGITGMQVPGARRSSRSRDSVVLRRALLYVGEKRGWLYPGDSIKSLRDCGL